MNACTLSGGGIEPYAAAPVVDNPLNDGQSKSSAFTGRPGGIKWIEGLLRDFGGHPAPGVGYGGKDTRMGGVRGGGALEFR